MLKVTEEIYILIVFHKYNIIKFSKVEECVKKNKLVKNEKIRGSVTCYYRFHNHIARYNKVVFSFQNYTQVIMHNVVLIFSCNNVVRVLF